MSDAGSSTWDRLMSRVTGREQFERITELERSVRKLQEAQRDQSTTLQQKLADMTNAVLSRATSKDAGELLDAVRALGAQIDRGVDDQLSHGGAAEQQRLTERRLFRRLDQIAAGSKPIVIGPWTGEVGFELLYWVPFIEWIRSRWNLAEARQVILSRGGVSTWYGIRDAKYVDIFSLVPPDRFRAGTNQDEHKQRRESAFDRELLESAHVGDAEHLHPELMYRVFMPYWRDEAGFGTLERFTRYRRFEPLDDPERGKPPREYVAARFYFSDCFPDTHENRAFARSVITAISAHVPVVLLNPGVKVDDHIDYRAGPGDRVITIADGLPPERNLAVQSAIISHARAFVGTYGGYSYLAPFYDVPTLAFYSVPTFKLHHLHAAQRVFERLGGATVLPIHVSHAPLIQLALATVATTSS
jgi:hypothetical protein